MTQPKVRVMVRIAVNSGLVCEKEAQRSIRTGAGKRLRNEIEGCQKNFAHINSSSKQRPGMLCIRTRSGLQIELKLCLKEKESPWIHFKVSEKLLASQIP